jgi:hypothetical protein
MIWNTSIHKIESEMTLDSAESETKERLMLQAKTALNRGGRIKKNSNTGF